MIARLLLCIKAQFDFEDLVSEVLDSSNLFLSCKIRIRQNILIQWKSKSEKSVGKVRKVKQIGGQNIWLLRSMCYLLQEMSFITETLRHSISPSLHYLKLSDISTFLSQ